ncbi:hypothetical protein KUTeg_001512 [Tegillarca granosa]|uniref:HP domain-containing protein n=1 Tax=Tegillarca granosa TaxID=220873 RepID=A0ABQ9FRR4_TEGGR|nr:hypothetical protein KUTeg_001512 [Tegillarca granosa]
MSGTDPAFRSIEKNKSCFHIWRIEKLQVCSVPKEQHGVFYKGDSYIILSVVEEGEIRGTNVKIKDVKGRMDAHIHFWLGSETSQDEAGVAAIKSVELDDHLGGFPVQHREVEGHESKLFLNYFKPKGIRYAKGGVASGFKHVDVKFNPRLLQVKGKQHVKLIEVDIEWASFNHGDVFIMDTGKIIFVWVGKDSSRTERLQAFKAARDFRDERGKTCRIEEIPDGDEDNILEQKEFEKFLPLSEKNIKTKEEGGTDESAEKNYNKEIKLYVCSDEDGTLKVTEVKGGPLSYKDLNPADAFIIDNGGRAIWTWIGKKASKKERSEAMRNALGFIKKKGLDASTPVSSVIDGGEPTDFKCLFKDWPIPKSSGQVYTKNKIATLHENKQLAAETQMYDDGTGTSQVWRIDSFDLVPVPAPEIGKFYAGDCYLILYTYLVNNKERHVIYYWQGAKSSTDERGTSALKAVELDDKYGGEPVQVRVVQGKEPNHFMSLFDGKMIIFSVKLSASSLNSNDVFVIYKKKALYIWAGKGSTGDEREMAKKMASNSPRQPEFVFEGQEKQSFWDAIGGQKPYSNDKRLQEEECVHPARLFQLSNASGRFTVEEIPDFIQSDLVADDVMILDCWNVVFVWIGEGANAAEKKEAERCAIEYVKTDPAGRDEDTPIIKVKQGFEPPTFTGFFGTWDLDLWNKGISYEQLSKQLRDENVEDATTNGGNDFSEQVKYKLEQLRLPIDELPSGVDPAAREVHLSHDDFQATFNMSYADFLNKPLWKQQALKKQAQLF